MTFVIILIGVVLDRLVEQLGEWRSRPWVDQYFRLLHERLDGVALWNGTLGVLAAVGLPVFMVWVLWLVLGSLAGFLGLLFALAVLVFSLGPRELNGEIRAYADAVHGEHTELARGIAARVLNGEPPADPAERHAAVSRAVFVEANERLFGVIFWFAVLGPVGAALFRISCQFRLKALREYGAESEMGDAAQRLHGILDWLPARLAAFSYALAGSFEEAMSDWKAYYENAAARFFQVTRDILVRTGEGGLGGAEDEAGEEASLLQVGAAINLVYRALIAWLAVLGLFTLAGLVI